MYFLKSCRATLKYGNIFIKFTIKINLINIALNNDHPISVVVTAIEERVVQEKGNKILIIIKFNLYIPLTVSVVYYLSCVYIRTSKLASQKVILASMLSFIH